MRVRFLRLKIGGKSLTQTENYLKQLPIQIMLGFVLYIPPPPSLSQTTHLEHLGYRLIWKEEKRLIDFLESLGAAKSIFWVSDLMVTKYTLLHANYTQTLSLSRTHTHTNTLSLSHFFWEGMKGHILRHCGKLNSTHPGERRQPQIMHYSCRNARAAVHEMK